MEFDEAYYRGIWPDQGVHRHDYVPDWANYLVQKYGKVSILDIGTGCGYLVKTLREMGCDAWGTEISEYALEHTCAPGFTVYGDLRDLPFRNNRFDVVHTHGVLTDVEEWEVDGVVRELYRVGRRQEHNIDYEGCIWYPEMLTVKPREWWDAKLGPF